MIRHLHINTHIATGIILSMFYSFFINNDILSIIIICCFSFLIDFDFIFSKYAKNRNHRILPTHGITLYLIILPFGIFNSIFYFVGLAGIFHVLMDCIDWGVGLFSPISKKIYFGILPKPPENIINEESIRKRQCWFTLTYYNSKILLIVEVLVLILSIFLVIYVNFSFWWFYILYSLFLMVHLYSFYRCKKAKN